MKVMIAPSLLSCDFAHLGREVEAIAKAGADLVHVDVMDGHFVPNITIGLPVVRSLKKISPLPLDVHLMISHPLKYAAEFAKAGSDYITFHIESEDDTAATLAAIRDGGAKAGLTLRPGTPVERLLPYLPEVDMVLIMTVEPGFGGQSFMADMLPKIEVVRRWKDEHKPHMLIEVDGGINKDTAPLAIAAGADVLVAGSAVFGRSDYAAAIAQLRP
jgi:ribulose-phosphate 3-epimerase